MKAMTKKEAILFFFVCSCNFIALYYKIDLLFALNIVFFILSYLLVSRKIKNLEFHLIKDLNITSNFTKTHLKLDRMNDKLNNLNTKISKESYKNLSLSINNMKKQKEETHQILKTQKNSYLAQFEVLKASLSKLETTVSNTILKENNQNMSNLKEFIEKKTSEAHQVKNSFFLE